MTLREICETVLGPIKWSETGDGMCKCPGEKKHTHRTGKCDCKIYTSGSVPTVYCFHENCREDVAKANLKIRDAWRLYVAEPVDEEELARARAAAAAKKELAERAAARLPSILSEYATEYSGDFSPEVWLKLYRPDEVLWCGEPFDTGGLRNCANFQPVEVAVKRYQRTGRLPSGQFTCPSVFNAGEIYRRNESVIRQPYLVLEGDRVGVEKVETAEERTLNRKNCSAVINWLSSIMKLVMVVDSGNKSLHGWFVHPGQAKLEELKIVLPALGFDRATLKPSQPVRMPGQLRDNGNRQRILYINN